MAVLESRLLWKNAIISSAGFFAMTSTAFATHNNGNSQDKHASNPSCGNPNSELKNKDCPDDDDGGGGGDTGGML